MKDFDNFEDVFGSSESSLYDSSTRKGINRNRSELHGHLIIDRLLDAIGVQSSKKQYPPHSNTQLKEIHAEITKSSSPDHQKHSVILYLLKDVARAVNLETKPEEFAQQVYLPTKYEVFIQGVWQLDRQQFEAALTFLTEPMLTPTFPDEILSVLCTKARSYGLPIAYYNCVSPPLSTGKVLDEYFTVLCRADLIEAFHFLRARDAASQSRLMTIFVKEALQSPSRERNAPHSSEAELASLVMDAEEEACFRKTLEAIANSDKDLQQSKDRLLSLRSVLQGAS